eukprot:g45670.t1
MMNKIISINSCDHFLRSTWSLELPSTSKQVAGGEVFQCIKAAAMNLTSDMILVAPARGFLCYTALNSGDRFALALLEWRPGMGLGLFSPQSGRLCLLNQL